MPTPEFRQSVERDAIAAGWPADRAAWLAQAVCNPPPEPKSGPQMGRPVKHAERIAAALARGAAVAQMALRRASVSAAASATRTTSADARNVAIDKLARSLWQTREAAR
jgi:hypothetical protein